MKILSLAKTWMKCQIIVHSWYVPLYLLFLSLEISASKNTSLKQPKYCRSSHKVVESMNWPEKLQFLL